MNNMKKRMFMYYYISKYMILGNSCSSRQIGEKKGKYSKVFILHLVELNLHVVNKNNIMLCCWFPGFFWVQSSDVKQLIPQVKEHNTTESVWLYFDSYKKNV